MKWQSTKRQHAKLYARWKRLNEQHCRAYQRLYDWALKVRFDPDVELPKRRVILQWSLQQQANALLDRMHPLRPPYRRRKKQ